MAAAPALLCPLNIIPDKHLPQLVVTNAQTIFNLKDTEVRETFDSKSVTVLKSTRDAMLTHFAELCPKYPANAAHARKQTKDIKETLVQDIIILGACIIAKGPVENMDLVYKITETPDFNNLTEPADKAKAIEHLFQLTQAMSLELQELRSVRDELQELKSVRDENIALKDRVAILEVQIGDLKAGRNIQHSPSELSNEGNDESDPIDDTIDRDVTESPRPVIGAIRTADVFIGRVAAPCSAYDIQNHIKKNTSVNPKISDIREIKVRGRNKAFRVNVPKDKLNEVIAESVWGSNITAERYDPQRPKTFNQPRGAKTNSHKTPNRDQSFRNQNRNRPSYNGNTRSSTSQNQQYQSRYSRDQYRPRHRD